MVGEKFCFNNKVKEVSFKILHKIYPTQKTLARFKLDIDPLCKFCGNEQETIHVLSMCILNSILDWCRTLYKDNNRTSDSSTGKGHFYLF